MLIRTRDVLFILLEMVNNVYFFTGTLGST